MIAKKHKPHKQRLSKTTIMTFRNLARKGSDMDIENFLYDACRLYLKQVTGNDYIDIDNYLEVDKTKYSCTCPECGCEMELFLKDLAGEKKAE